MSSTKTLPLFQIINFSVNGKQDRRLLINVGDDQDQLFMPSSVILKNVDKLMWADFEEKNLIRDGGYKEKNDTNMTLYDITLMPENFMIMLWFNKDTILFCRYSRSGMKSNSQATFEWNGIIEGQLYNRYGANSSQDYYNMDVFSIAVKNKIDNTKPKAPVAMFLQFPEETTASMSSVGFDVKMSYKKDFESYMKFLAMIYMTRETLLPVGSGKYLIRPNITAINEIEIVDKPDPKSEPDFVDELIAELVEQGIVISDIVKISTQLGAFINKGEFVVNRMKDITKKVETDYTLSSYPPENLKLGYTRDNKIGLLQTLIIYYAFKDRVPVDDRSRLVEFKTVKLSYENEVAKKIILYVNKDAKFMANLSKGVKSVKGSSQLLNSYQVLKNKGQL